MASAVSDDALDDMRGGALTINGVTFDFSYMARVSVVNEAHNINSIEERAFNTVNMPDVNAQAALQQAMQPININSELQGSVISVMQNYDIIASGLTQNLINTALQNQLAYANILAARGS